MGRQKTYFTKPEFAALGLGEVAYLKKMRSDDLKERFPDLPPMEAGLDLWALFGAGGEPIVFTDVRANALASAYEYELQTVSLQ